jgi:hypothetical protein
MTENYYPSQTLPNSTTAIISLITGILGVTFLPVIGSIIALITGYMARKEINESNGTLAGSGMATAGIVLGWIGIALLCLFACLFVAMIAFFGLFMIPFFSNSSTDFNLFLVPVLTLFV